MILALLTIFILAIYKADWQGKGFHSNYIAIDTIQPIKGIFILMIFISHFVPYTLLKKAGGSLDMPYFAFQSFMGQLVVALFLFYSGFGIAESIAKKGAAYVHSMPVRRLLQVLFQFDVAVLIFVCINASRGKLPSIGHFLRSLVAWDSVGNSNWYILIILVLYAFTYIGYWIAEKLGKDITKEWKLPFAIIVTLSIAFILLNIYLKRPSRFYNTVMVYSAGMLYSFLRFQVEQFLFKSERRYWLCVLCAVILFLGAHSIWRKNVIYYELTCVLFAITVVWFTAKLQITNPLLDYCGRHLFSLYILQRIPMLLLASSMAKNYPYEYFIICLLTTFALSAIFDKVMGAIWKRMEVALL